MNRSRLFTLAVAGTRVFLGLIFFTSGMAKLTNGDFFGLIGPVWLEERVAPYGLGLWARFVAWSQAGVGLLLLSQRFATLGAVMLVPMLANILVITISLQWRGTPYVNAVLLAMNLFLLYADRRRLMGLVEAHGSPSNRDALVAAGLAIGLLGPLLYDVHRTLTFVCAGTAVAAFAIAAIRMGRQPHTRPG